MEFTDILDDCNMKFGTVTDAAVYTRCLSAEEIFSKYLDGQRRIRCSADDKSVDWGRI